MANLSPDTWPGSEEAFCHYNRELWWPAYEEKGLVWSSGLEILVHAQSTLPLWPVTRQHMMVDSLSLWPESRIFFLIMFMLLCVVQLYACEFRYPGRAKESFRSPGSGKLLVWLLGAQFMSLVLAVPALNC